VHGLSGHARFMQGASWQPCKPVSDRGAARRRYGAALEALYAEHEARQKETVDALKLRLGESASALERVKQVGSNPLPV
jgi:hypothetical protein